MLPLQKRSTISTGSCAADQIRIVSPQTSAGGQYGIHRTLTIPRWIGKLELRDRFVFHSAKRLFTDELIPRTLNKHNGYSAGAGAPHPSDVLPVGLTGQSWGNWDWPLVLSTPDRAVLELLEL